MNQLKAQIIQKLNVIVELIKHCASKALPIQNQSLMQEVTLAIITHEGLCKLFEQEGSTENVVSLINDFGMAVAELYNNISTFKSDTQLSIALSSLSKRPDKNLLN